MNRVPENIERLFSRYLDGECTAAERTRLHGLLRSDPAVRAAFEDYRDLDRALGVALRTALGRQAPVLRLPIRRFRLATGLTLAAAAVLALFVWLNPWWSRPFTPKPPSGPVQAAATWFAAQPGVEGDAIQPASRGYVRPELRLRDTRRQWIVVPGREPGRYLIIEVDRVRTHAIGVHQDF